MLRLSIRIRESLRLMCELSFFEVSGILIFERAFRGEYGMGTQANELALGCDCLGKIHYLVSNYFEDYSF